MKKSLLPLFIVFLLTACNHTPETVIEVQQKASIYPDYSEVLFPSNISAPNFLVEDKAHRHFVKIYSETPDTIKINAIEKIQIPLRQWIKLLSKNEGKTLYVDIFSQTDSGWIKYPTIYNRIDSLPIDPFLIYRIVTPGNARFNFLGIYERNLTNYKERLIVSNKHTGGCINCHTFNQNDPKQMLMHFRIIDAGLLKIQGDSVTKIDNTKTGDLNIKLTYPAWHPNGRFIAFSTNQVNPFNWVEPHARFDGTFDTLSDIVLYDIEQNTIIHFPELSLPDYEENFPAWTPDGTQLYFCRYKHPEWAEETTPMEHMKKIKHDLVFTTFDEKTKSFSEPRLVIKGQERNSSINFPRITNDGRFLMFCEAKCNAFPTIQESSDLRLLDLKTMRIDSMNSANSNQSESFHSWSSDSRWFVFSSKRTDANFVQLYMAKVDDSGRVSKPFVLPQKSGDFYKAYLRSYNIPELIKSPIPKTYYQFMKVAAKPARPTEHRFEGDSAFFSDFHKIIIIENENAIY